MAKQSTKSDFLKALAKVRKFVPQPTKIVPNKAKLKLATEREKELRNDS